MANATADQRLRDFSQTNCAAVPEVGEVTRRDTFGWATGLGALLAFNPAIAGASAPLPDGVRLEAEGLGFPEGLFRFPDGTLGCVDIAAGQLLTIAADGSARVIARPGPGPNGAALLHDGDILVANNGGIAFRRTAQGLRVAGLPADLQSGSIVVVTPDGAVRTLYTHCDGRPLNGPNDVLLDGQRGFWFTDTGKIRPTGQDPGALFHARLDGSAITRVLDALESPNGLCHTTDGDVLLALSRSRTIVRIDRVTHTVRRFAQLPGTMMLDNLVCAEDGTVLAGCVAPGGIAMISRSGTLQSMIPLPDFAVTALAFMGRDRRRLAACLSTTGKIVSLPWPVAGLDRATMLEPAA